MFEISRAIPALDQSHLLRVKNVHTYTNSRVAAQLLKIFEIFSCGGGGRFAMFVLLVCAGHTWPQQFLGYGTQS